MGRYYGTAHFDGKFGFGTQSSYDPVEFFGMNDDTSENDDESEGMFSLSASEAELKRIKALIDSQYDFLGIPAEKRKYKIEDGSEIWDLLEQFEGQLYRPFIRGKDKGIPYWSKKHMDGIIERKPGIQLAKCRIDLGCKIYTELLNDGFCWMWAEL